MKNCFAVIVRIGLSSSAGDWKWINGEALSPGVGETSYRNEVAFPWTDRTRFPNTPDGSVVTEAGYGHLDAQEQD